MILSNKINEWRRVGGKRKQLFVTDEDIENVLEQLPNEFSPYFLVVPYNVQTDKRKYVEYADILDLGAFRFKREEGVWDFFLGSEVLSPGLKDIISGRVSIMCSYNGLVHIQQGLIRSDGVHLESSISIVDKVISTTGNEVRYYKEYNKIYRNMCKELSCLLKYETIYEFKNGDQIISKKHFMSQGVKDLIEDGQVNYSVKPGRKI